MSDAIKNSALYQKIYRLSGFVRKFGLYRLKQWIWSIFRYTAIIGISFVIIYPILLMLSNSFKNPAEMFDSTVVWVPKHFTLETMVVVVKVMDYPQAFFNSLSLSLMTSILHVLSCMLAGYGFARFAFKGRGILFALVLLTLIVPPQTLMIPQYLHFRFFDLFGIFEATTGKPGINILDSYWPFILSSGLASGLKNGLYILIFRQFFRGLPKEIEEAALADGAGVFRTFFRIMLPNAIPAITTVFLFSFVWQWNDSYFVSLYLEQTKVLPLVLESLAGNVALISGEQTGMSPYFISLLNNAGSLLVIAPLVILYLFAQRYFVESVERSGLVG